MTQSLLIRAAKIKQSRSRIKEFLWGGKRGCYQTRVQVASEKNFDLKLKGMPETQKESRRDIASLSDEWN